MAHTRVMSTVFTRWFTPKSPKPASLGEQTAEFAHNRRRFERQPPGPKAAKLSWPSSSGSTRSAAVEVQDFSAEGVAISIPESIAVGQTVLLNWSLSEKKGAIRYCRWDGQGFRAGVRLVPHERRRHNRLSATGLGELCWKDRSGASRTVMVTVSNVTEDGIQIEMIEEIPAQSHVRISGETMECLGVLLYCANDGAKFVGGVQLVRPAYAKNSAEYLG